MMKSIDGLALDSNAVLYNFMRSDQTRLCLLVKSDGDVSRHLRSSRSLMDKFSDLLSTNANDKDKKGKYLKPMSMKRARSDAAIRRDRASTDEYDPNIVYGLGKPIDETVVAELNDLAKHNHKRKSRSKSVTINNRKKKKNNKVTLKSHTRMKRIRSPVIGGDEAKHKYVFNDDEY